MSDARVEGLATPPARDASPWNLANALTGFRLVLVPLFGWLLLHDDGRSTGWRLLAAGAFTVASITDRVDGEVARRSNQVTDVGTIADPIADKALIGMALVGLSVIGDLPWWVTVVVLVREVGITALRFVVIRHGVIPASRGGKTKTVLQVVAIALYVLPLPDELNPLLWVVMAAAVLVTVVTGVDYVARAVRLRRGSERTRRKHADRQARG